MNTLDLNHISDEYDLDIILLDLIMYEDDDLYCAAMALLTERYHNKSSLLEAMSKSELLKSSKIPVFYTFKQVDNAVSKIRYLILTFEQWGVDNDFSPIDRTVYAKVHRLLDKFREFLLTKDRAVEGEEVEQKSEIEMRMMNFSSNRTRGFSEPPSIEDKIEPQHQKILMNLLLGDALVVCLSWYEQLRSDNTSGGPAEHPGSIRDGDERKSSHTTKADTAADKSIGFDGGGDDASAGYTPEAIISKSMEILRLLVFRNKENQRLVFVRHRKDIIDAIRARWVKFPVLTSIFTGNRQ